MLFPDITARIITYHFNNPSFHNFVPQEWGSGVEPTPTGRVPSNIVEQTTKVVEIITELYTGPPDNQFQPTTTSPSVAVTPDNMFGGEEVCMRVCTDV